jgi:membrane glycosyltransferase
MALESSNFSFAEAALLVKENCEAWFACDLEGSYEEAPQSLIANAQRDRRWCQGNLQHGLLLFAKGIAGVSRMHLILGIFGYLAGPLWLLFLITFFWMRWFHAHTGLSEFTMRAFTPFLNISSTAHALLIFTICMVVLFLPKILALVDLALDPERRRKFGGFFRGTAGVFVETIFSALQAPLQMLWHTRFVVGSLLGVSVNWGPQDREADGTSWLYACRHHWGQTLIGIAWGWLVFRLDRAVF